MAQFGLLQLRWCTFRSYVVHNATATYPGHTCHAALAVQFGLIRLLWCEFHACCACCVISKCPVHPCHAAVAHALSTTVPQGLVHDRLRLGEDLTIDAVADTLRELIVLYEEVIVRAVVHRFNEEVHRCQLP